MSLIAIDGPAASGKSSVARRLATALGFSYVNSGGMYRTFTWEALRAGVDATDAEAVAHFARAATVSWEFDGDGVLVFGLNGHTSTDHLRDDLVNRHVSAVSAVPAVREVISRELRTLAADRPVVMEGRDIGTAVFPETPFKFYLDASPEVRRQRRAAEGQDDHIEHRDRIDSSRTTAPLAKASDAMVVDTSHLTLEGVVAAILAELARRGITPP